MADEKNVVHLGENSPEEVAFKLLHLIAKAEKKYLNGTPTNPVNSDRKWILETYSECLGVVKGRRP